MDSKAYEVIKKKFYEKREEKIKKANQKKERIYLENEILKNLEEKKNLLALKITRNILNEDKITSRVEQENMKIKLDKIDKQIEKEYKSLGIDKNDFLPDFDCKICNDTGIMEIGGKKKYCTCFTQAVINETYKQVNILKIDVENFDTFEMGFYSTEVNKEKYGLSKSPRQNIEQIKNIATHFSDNIDLSSAKKVLDMGKSVIYQTSPIFMDSIMQYKFSFDNEKKEMYNKIFEVDLLIIDDLGTETMTNNKYTELFNVINTRLLKNKKIIISTNLTLNELFNRYDERIISRLIGEFKICKFIGEDIRLKKKKLSTDMLNN